MAPRNYSLLTKRVLIDLSHAIERFALAGDPDGPMVVIALFQRSSYFQREARVYQQIADQGAMTLVALVEDFPPELPIGVRHQLLAEDDPLAREWSVTVLGPRGGASLVAIDQETVATDAETLEQGRLFHGRWSFSRAEAYQQVLRLRSELRLPADTVAQVDAILQSVLSVPEPPDQGRWDAPLRFLADRVERAVRGRDRARAELAAPQERDQRTGLHTMAYLQRWTAGLGRGTLSIGLVALRLVDLRRVRAQYGMRAELAAVQTVARVLEELVGAPDRVIQVGREVFLFVLPSATTQRVLSVARQACTSAAGLEERYPFVTLDAVVTGAVSRERPLPLDRLLEELEQLEAGPDPVHLIEA